MLRAVEYLMKTKIGTDKLKCHLHSIVWAWRYLRDRNQHRELGCLKQYIHPEAVCIDIGAHAGSWLFPLARLAPRGQVIGFEALPYYARTLKLTAQLLRVRNVTVVNQAVTAERCSVPIKWKDSYGKRLTGYTHIATGDEIKEAVIDVQGDSIDNYLAQQEYKIQFIKCDVEGAEYGVFLGARKVLARDRPVVYTEFVEHYLNRYGRARSDILMIFNELQYSAYALHADGQLLPVSEPVRWPGNDVCFIPNEMKV